MRAADLISGEPGELVGWESAEALQIGGVICAPVQLAGMLDRGAERGADRGTAFCDAELQDVPGEPSVARFVASDRAQRVGDAAVGGEPGGTVELASGDCFTHAAVFVAFHREPLEQRLAGAEWACGHVRQVGIVPR